VPSASVLSPLPARVEQGWRPIYLLHIAATDDSGELEAIGPLDDLAELRLQTVEVLSQSAEQLCEAAPKLPPGAIARLMRFASELVQIVILVVTPITAFPQRLPSHSQERLVIGDLNVIGGYPIEKPTDGTQDIGVFTGGDRHGIVLRSKWAW
jgi:hypothetical protein